MFHIRQLFRLFPLFSVAIAAAQIPPGDPILVPPPMQDWALAWHPDVDPALAGQAVVGDFTGDGLPDVAQIAGTKLHFYIDPGSEDARLQVNMTFGALACMSHGSPTGNDRLACVGPNGFGFLDFDRSANDESTAFNLHPLSWTGWEHTFDDARGLVSADLDADGDQDFLVLAANTKTVYRLINTAGDLQPTSGFTSNLGIQEMFALQWDDTTDTPDPGLEVAVVDSLGLKVFKPYGPRCRLINGAVAGSAGFIAKVGQDYGAAPHRDAVAWVSYVNATDQKLSIVALGGVGEQSFNLPTGLDVFSIAGADMDLDGDDDLVFSTRVNSVQSMRSYNNDRTVLLPDNVRFNCNAATDVDVALSCTPAPADHASILLADLNGDRLKDTYVCVPSGPCALAILNGYMMDQVTETGDECCVSQFMTSPYSHPLFHSAAFFTDELVDHLIATSTPGSICCAGNGTLMLNLSNVWGITNLSAFHIEVVTWYQAYNTSTGLGYPNPMGITRTDFACEQYPAFPSSSSYAFSLPIAVPTAALNPNNEAFPDCYYLRVRCFPNNPTSNDEPVVTYVIGFTGDPIDGNIQSYPYLTGLDGAWSATIPFEFNSLDQPPEMAFRKLYAGGTVPQARMPRFSNGQIPHVPPTTNPAATPLQN